MNKLSYEEFLKLEKRFYETTTHLRIPFWEYLCTNLNLPKTLCSKLRKCHTHSQVYALVKENLIDWEIPLSPKMKL